MHIYYYECHITIEPVFDEPLQKVAELAKSRGFKLANLLMQKRAEDQPERSKHDTFMTAHSGPENVDDLIERMKALITDLQSLNFKVWRYKIEAVTIDSRNEDIFNMVDKK